jgi:hypothetical protein
MSKGIDFDADEVMVFTVQEVETPQDQKLIFWHLCREPLQSNHSPRFLWLGFSEETCEFCWTRLMCSGWTD